MTEIVKGSKYEVGMDIAEIAKRVRADIKAAQEKNELPADATFSVRTRRFSGGQALDVTILGMPDSWIYVSPGLEPDYANYIPAHGGQTDEAKRAGDLVGAIVFAYNYDGSDVQSDYSNVNFYSHVTIQDEREARWAEAEKARKDARRAARSR